MKPVDTEPEISPWPPRRNNRLRFRLKNNHSNPISNPPTKASFDAEKPVEAIPEKPTTDDDGEAPKKQKVPFADETAVDENVKSFCLGNKNATGKFSSLTMKLSEATEVKNKERAMFPIVFVSEKTSNKEIEDNVSTFLREMPPRNPNNPLTQTSSDDSEQRIHTDKDAENPIEAICKKPTTADDDGKGVTAKERKVSFADETAANTTVKPWSLRNKKPKCSPPPPPIKLDEADEENSDEMKNHMKSKISILISNKKKEDFLGRFTGKKPSKNPKRRPRNVQKAIDRVSLAFKIPEIIDEARRRDAFYAKLSSTEKRNLIVGTRNLER